MGFATGPRIYNMFPRLVGSFDGWGYHFDRIKAMGFDWVYVNPFHFPGYSGSLYAVKDYYRFHPLFVNDALSTPPEAQLQSAIEAAHARGLRFMMDLVINHTAFDSVIADAHPEWFEQGPDGQLVHPGCLDGETWVEWGDLVKLNNGPGPHAEGLWRYWLAMMRAYIAMGVDGFRCDAAYHVPGELWRFLIAALTEEYPAVRFFGETLGCRPCEVVEVAACGFDYVFNSVRWWDYEAAWFPDAFARVVGAAPSIGFPESHDTARVAEEVDGNEAALKQKYTFAALFATGVMLPIGYEFGFRKRLDVVTTQPADWETPPCDLVGFIGRVNALKGSLRIFNVEGPLLAIETHNPRLKAYLKTTPDAREKALFVLNLDHENWQELHLPSVADAMGTRYVRDVSLENRWDSIDTDMTGRIAPGACQVLLGTLEGPIPTGVGGETTIGHALPSLHS